MKITEKRTILFITGAFVSHHVWDQWMAYFGNLGYATIAPPWPSKEGTADQLRRLQPHDTALAALTLEEVIAHYAQLADRLNEKPIIIGHSLGGLITQVLLNRGLAYAAVAIHSVPPQGIFPYEFTFLRSAWRVLGIFSSMRKTYLMSFKTFQYAFVNTLPPQDQQTAYEAYVIPESKKVARGGLSGAAAVDFVTRHAPLLITAGSNDNVIPAHLSLRNFKAYKQNGSVLAYKEFATSHNVLAQEGWQQEAGFIGQWIEAQLPRKREFNPNSIVWGTGPK